MKGFEFLRLAASGLLGTANGAEALLELVDASLGVHKGALTCEEGVGIGGEAHRDHEMLNSLNFLYLVRLGGGTGDVAVTGGHVLEDYGMVVGMDVFFHGMPLKFGVRRFRRRAAGCCRKKPSMSTRFKFIHRSNMNLKTFASMDPHLLVGLANTELRNNASSLDDLCKTHGLDQEALVNRLAEAGYHFLEETKQFR